MDYICGMLNRFRKMPKTYYKNTFCNGFTGKATGLQWYFNGNHWNFCDGFYRASIVFLSRDQSAAAAILRLYAKAPHLIVIK